MIERYNIQGAVAPRGPYSHAVRAGDFLFVSGQGPIDAATNDYVEAARALGNPPWRVAVRHVLPNIIPPVMVQATLAIAGAIIAEASLSFLGLGQQPPAPSWGSS